LAKTRERPRRHHAVQACGAGEIEEASSIDSGSAKGAF
jgi:hypothetical protein